MRLLSALIIALPVLILNGCYRVQPIVQSSQINLAPLFDADGVSIWEWQGNESSRNMVQILDRWKSYEFRLQLIDDSIYVPSGFFEKLGYGELRDFLTHKEIGGYDWYALEGIWHFENGPFHKWDTFRSKLKGDGPLKDGYRVSGANEKYVNPDKPGHRLLAIEGGEYSLSFEFYIPEHDGPQKFTFWSNDHESNLSTDRQVFQRKE